MTEMAALHRAVAHRAADRPRRRWGPRTIGLFLGIGVLPTTGTAFAVETGPPPRPVAAVAHSLGLPVASPELRDARTAPGRLRGALESRDDRRIRAAAAELQ